MMMMVNITYLIYLLFKIFLLNNCLDDEDAQVSAV